jgi:hypothetical protein
MKLTIKLKYNHSTYKILLTGIESKIIGFICQCKDGNKSLHGTVGGGVARLMSSDMLMLEVVPSLIRSLGLFHLEVN